MAAPACRITHAQVESITGDRLDRLNRRGANNCQYLRDAMYLQTHTPVRVIGHGLNGVVVELTPDNATAHKIAKFTVVHPRDATRLTDLTHVDEIDGHDQTRHRKSTSHKAVMIEHDRAQRARRTLGAHVVPDTQQPYFVQRRDLPHHDSSVNVQDFVDGQYVAQRLHNETDPDVFAAFGRRVGDIIATIVNDGYFHGDLHGGNVLVRRDDDQIVVIDWARSDPLPADDIEISRQLIVRDVVMFIYSLLCNYKNGNNNTDTRHKLMRLTRNLIRTVVNRVARREERELRDSFHFDRETGDVRARIVGPWFIIRDDDITKQQLNKSHLVFTRYHRRMQQDEDRTQEAAPPRAHPARNQTVCNLIERDLVIDATGTLPQELDDYLRIDPDFHTHCSYVRDTFHLDRITPNDVAGRDDIAITLLWSSEFDERHGLMRIRTVADDTRHNPLSSDGRVVTCTQLHADRNIHRDFVLLPERYHTHDYARRDTPNTFNRVEIYTLIDREIVLTHAIRLARQSPDSQRAVQSLGHTAGRVINSMHGAGYTHGNLHAHNMIIENERHVGTMIGFERSTHFRARDFPYNNAYIMTLKYIDILTLVTSIPAPARDAFIAGLITSINPELTPHLTEHRTALLREPHAQNGVRLYRQHLVTLENQHRRTLEQRALIARQEAARLESRRRAIDAELNNHRRVRSRRNRDETDTDHSEQESESESEQESERESEQESESESEQESESESDQESESESELESVLGLQSALASGSSEEDTESGSVGTLERAPAAVGSDFSFSV